MAEITQSQLAKIAGLKRQAIYNAVRRNQLDINSSNMIDTQNKKNSQWMSSRGISEQMVIQYLNEIPEKKQPKQKTQTRSEQNDKVYTNNNKSIPIVTESTTFESSNTIPQEDIEFESITGLPAKMMYLNLKQLVMRYGGPMMLDSWSKILQRIMSANEKDQKIQERRLELIDKDFVVSGIFSYLNILSDNLFDLAESQTKIIIAAVQSNPEKADIVIRDMRLKSYSKIIKDCKRSLERSLKQLKSKHDNTDNTET